MRTESRITGALLGFAAGDALGATTEFMTPKDIRKAFKKPHTEIVGGGVLNWRAGQGTDDSDLMFRHAKVVRRGFSTKRLADSYLAWLDKGPKDVGGTTAQALHHYDEFRDPYISGAAVATDFSAGNGSLMCALPSGLDALSTDARTFRAINAGGITHSDPRCMDACVVYAHIVAELVRGRSPWSATVNALRFVPEESHVEQVLLEAPEKKWHELRFTGYVLHSLEVAVWAMHQDSTLERLLVDIVNEGDDADTTAAIAGGVLGARDGVQGVPKRWVRKLEYRDEAVSLGKWFDSRHHS